MEHRVLGRSGELDAIHGLLDLDRVAGLTFTGEAGIGKSALLECALDLAAERGYHVLLARSSEAATVHGFGVVADLLAGVDLATAALDSPLRRALAAALLREVPGEPVDAGAVVRGAADVFAALAAEDPLLVAVDDVQWSDAESVQVLAQLVRHATPIRFLLTRRSGHPMTAVESALRRRELETVEVGTLGKEEIGQLLSQRLGLSLPRWVSGRIAEHACGNPLFALEFGRVLRQRGMPEFGAPLAVPADLQDLLAQRVEELPAEHLELLLAAAVEPQVTDSHLTRLGGAETLREALASRVLVADPVTGRVRPSHPMLGAAAWAAVPPVARRNLHSRLAEVLGDHDLALRHRALGAESCDESLAQQLDVAAARAADAGATESAAELARLALDLSVSTAPQRPLRVLALARRLAEVGAGRDLTTLLDRELSALPAGELRCRAWLLATEGELDSVDQVIDYLDRAIHEAAALPELRAQCLSTRAAVMAVVRVRSIPEAVRTGDDAVTLDPHSNVGASWARAMAGLSDPDPVDDGGTASRHSWRGDLTRSRQLLTERIAGAEHSGDHGDFLLATMLLGEVELRAGRLEEAGRLIDLVDAAGFDDLFETPDVARCRARLAALHGDREQSVHWATQARSAAEAAGSGWIELDLMVTDGLVAARGGELGCAVACFGGVWDRCREEGVENPGAFPVALELVAARLAIDEVTAARDVVTRLLGAAVEQEHPWGLTISRLADPLVGLYDRAGDPRGLADAATLTAQELEGMGFFFDAARARAVAGTFLRRHRQWGSARQLLENAATSFRRIGATGWVEPVTRELSKVGGRRPSSGRRLTPAEVTTAELAASGLSNQQIAHRTATSVRTVEAHLTRVYAKLAITTRRQLPAALADSEESAPRG